MSFIYKRKKNEDTKFEGCRGERGLERLWGGRLGRGKCDLNPSSEILRELTKRNKQAINKYSREWDTFRDYFLENGNSC